MIGNSRTNKLGARVGWGLLVGLAVAMGAPAAHADEAEATADSAAAQALFDEGKSLMDAGKVGAACEKFEESLKLDYGMGAQFKLADCMERLGRTASAWSAFLEVAAFAKRQGDVERETIARDRAAKLEPFLSRLRIVVTSPVEGMKVTRGPVEVGQAQWGMAVPTDAGEYEIRAEAPGMKPFSTRVTVNRTGAVTLTVPELDRLPSGAVAATPGSATDSPADEDGIDPMLIGAWSLLGVGAIGIGVGAVAGVVSMGKGSDAEPHCQGNVCDAEGVDLRDGAITAGNVSTVAFIIGGVAAAGGAALWITVATGSSDAATTGSTQLGVGPGSVSVRGTF